MAQIGSPSAGWYTDPSGQHRARYWDGASWTEQVRDDLTEPTGVGEAAAGAHPVADTVASVAEAVAAVAADSGRTFVWWLCQPGNETALAFYRKLAPEITMPSVVHVRVIGT